MTRVVQTVVVVTVISVFSLQSVYPNSIGLPGFPWSWGNANITRLYTSPKMAERYPLIYPFQQCSAGMEGLMTRLFLYPCVIDNGRCQLTRGENVTLDLEFVSNIPVDSLVGSLSAIFTRWFSDFSAFSLVDKEDLCKSEQITCPIQPFYPYRYTTSIFIIPSLPALSPDIKVLIKTRQGRDVACAIVPVTIKLERNGLSDYPSFVEEAGSHQQSEILVVQ